MMNKTNALIVAAISGMMIGGGLVGCKSGGSAKTDEGAGGGGETATTDTAATADAAAAKHACKGLNAC